MQFIPTYEPADVTEWNRRARALLDTPNPDPEAVARLAADCPTRDAETGLLADMARAGNRVFSDAYAAAAEQLPADRFPGEMTMREWLNSQ